VLPFATSAGSKVLAYRFNTVFGIFMKINSRSLKIVLSFLNV